MPTVPLAPREVASLADELESRPAEEVLAWAAQRFAGRMVLTCSWQRQSSVLVHMVSELGLDVRIVEIDTGLLFPETHETRERLIARYGIEVERISPARTVAEQGRDEGPELWRRDPDRCCALRKVAPFERALDGMEAWVTGIRRQQSVSRAGARKLEWDPARGIAKVQPLADWTDEDVQGYLFARDIPYNRLHDEGYPSIGCMPCTQAVTEGDGERAGRWAGRAKTECGLHSPALARD
jgi:phosphoadenosine phosphosulfate reductase